MNSDVARRLVTLRDLQAADEPKDFLDAGARVSSEYYNMVTMRVRQVHLASCRSIRVRQAGGISIPTVQASLREATVDGQLVAFAIRCDCGSARVVDVSIL
jgi:triosephosphate isomerase